MNDVLKLRAVIPTAEVLRDFAHHGHYLQERNLQLQQLVEYVIVSWEAVYLTPQGRGALNYTARDAIEDTVIMDLLGFEDKPLDRMLVQAVVEVCIELYWRLFPLLNRLGQALHFDAVRLNDWIGQDLVVEFHSRD